MSPPSIETIKNKSIKFFEKKVLSNLNFGTNIYERNWKILIVLDACRYDLFKEFAPEHDCYDWFSEVESIRSVASSTQIWLPRTFLTADRELVNKTHYISGVGQTKKHLPQDIFYQIDDVWEYANDPDYGQTNPEAITDAAIAAIRNSGASKFIIHYPEPHAPFHHCIGKYGAVGKSQDVWNKSLADGEVDKSEVWDDYGQNLLMVLEEVEKIIRNSDGRIIVTSDHGNALGEWGFYGHPRHVPISSIRRVPWAETSGIGENNYEVKGKEKMTTEVENLSVEENLEALGYV